MSDKEFRSNPLFNQLDNAEEQTFTQSSQKELLNSGITDTSAVKTEGELYISWPEYREKIEHLAVKIYQSDWEFNQIVCLAKGGLRVGDILCRLYQQPLAILSVSSYGGWENRQRSRIKLAENLTMTTDGLGSHILLVDDLVDSGISLQESIAWLHERYGEAIAEIRTAVLWYKASSILAPNYYVDYLPDNPWIHQPFEGYEQINLSQLATRYIKSA